MKYVILVRRGITKSYLAIEDSLSPRIFNTQDEAYEHMHIQDKPIGSLYYVATLSTYFDLGGIYENRENVSASK